MDSYDSKAGEANYNTVEVNMASDSKFYAKLVFGGRSAQLDGITVPVHAGFDTNYNTVTINNGIGDKSAEDLDCGDTLITDLGVVVSKGIFGAEGYRTNNNKVALTDAVIVSGMPTARKLGLVGGRGLYYYRINAASNDFVNGTEIYSDGSGKKVSAIANNNVVSIKNSYIGYYISKNDNDWNTNWANSTYPEADADHSSVGFTVYGGWSTGIASNNIVAVEDSVINGNVIGGFEFRDQLQVNKDSLRDLSTNIVSLKDTVLKKGSSIYGSATAVGTSSSKGENFLQEDSTKLVNRRRGVAYIAGKVAADSAYVRYISFGQYLELDKLNNEVSYTVSQGYYPTEGQDVELETSLNSSLESGSLESVTKHLTGKEERSIHLGQQVAQSYLINRNGYHSSLAPSSTDNGISQSDVTKGQHNFWVGAYANLSDSVNGDGTSFDTKVKLFNDEENVNHGYAGGELSLLTHDDGMWYDYTSREQDGSLGAENSNHRPALMHQFRYHYQGLVLYLGVNDGESGEPVVQISFDEIANFRKEQNQNTNAFGNTFIGIIKDGTVYQKGSNEEGNKTVDASLMTFDVPGFEINQGGDHVADATYAFYKYMHFDGHDGEFEDENAAGEKISVSGKVSDPGEAGVGIKYWLKSVNILPGKLLVLNGKLENSELYVEDFQSGDTSKPKQELFTLSAELTGAGGVAIAKNSTVIIGSPDTIYNIDVGKTNTEPSVSGNGQALYEVVSKAPQPNSYTGNTVVDEGAMLVLGIDGALGTQGKSDTEDRYTSILHIGSFEAGSNPPPASVYLQGHIQTVGALRVAEGSVLDFDQAAPISFEGDDSEEYQANMGPTGGELTVKNKNQNSDSDQQKNGTWVDAIDGSLKGSVSSKLIFIDRKQASINSDNPSFYGTVELKASNVYLTSSEALISAVAHVDKDSSLYFDIQKNTSAQMNSLRTRANSERGNYTAAVRGIQNNGSVYLSHQVSGDMLNRSAAASDVSLNKVHVGTYTGGAGSKLFYQGFVQGTGNSDVDVVYADTASGESTVYFINENGKFGALLNSRGEYVGAGDKNGILVFEVEDPDAKVKLSLPAEEGGVLRVVAKDNEKYVWEYSLAQQGEDGNDWYLVNRSEDLKPAESPVPPMPDADDLRPEGGAYMANSQSWAKMHMRLHDRFGQAYYIDPFDGEEKRAAAWVRQVGSHSHFRSDGGASKTHARTAVSQIGADLIRNEINEDWKYIGGVFAGGLYHRANTRTFAEAKSRSDGYAVGIYGTLYTGNSPDDGFYVDSWLLYGRYDNKLWGGMTPTFDYKSHGWVWSVESGYTIPLGESGTKDFNKVIWTFQPEVQLVWDGVKAKDGYDATDTKYKQLGKDNVSIRVGARVHGNYMNKGLGFIEGNWIHNTKKTGVQMGSAKTYMDGGRNLGEFRMGLEGHITRNTLGWATVGVQAGKAGYHNETAQIGIKYMF